MKTLSFEMNMDSPLIAAEEPTQRVMEIAITAPEDATNIQRPALNIALVIDRSGSMGGEKLEYVKKAAEHVLDLLQDQDRVSLVAYDSEVRLLSPSVAVTREARNELKTILRRLTAGSMTFLSGGWLQGCKEVAEAAQVGMLNRVLLLTDGLANQGITDLEELGLHASQLASLGVPTSTFGVGVDYDEHLLEHIANQGGGQYYYIDHPHKIPHIFEQELKEIAAITASNVEVVIDLPQKTAAEVLGGWRSEKKANKLHLWLGDIAASQKREVYLQLNFPPKGKADQITLKAHLLAKDVQGNVLDAEKQLELHYVPASEARSAPLDNALRQRFSQVAMAEAKNEALKKERQGDYQGAANYMLTALAANERYLTQEDIEEAKVDTRKMQQGLAMDERKVLQYRSYTRRQRRTTNQ